MKKRIPMMVSRKNIFSNISRKPTESIRLEGEEVKKFYQDVLKYVTTYFREIFKSIKCENPSIDKHMEFGDFFVLENHSEDTDMLIRCLSVSKSKSEKRDDSLSRSTFEVLYNHNMDYMRNMPSKEPNIGSNMLFKKDLIDKITELLIKTIPFITGKQKELFEFYYTFFVLIGITLVEPDPLTAIQSWISIIFPEGDPDLDSYGIEENVSWITVLKREIMKNNISNYDDLLNMDEIQNEYFYVITRQYNKIFSTCQGLIKLILSILENSYAHDGFESVGRSIFKLDWKLSLRYLMFTRKSEFFFDLISQKCGLSLEEYQWLYGFKQAKNNIEFLERYVKRLKENNAYDEIVALGNSHQIDVFDDDLLKYCLENNKSFGENLGVCGEKAKFLENCAKIIDGNFEDQDAAQCLNFCNNVGILEILFEKIISRRKISDELLIACLKKILIFKEYKNIKKYRAMILKISLSN